MIADEEQVLPHLPGKSPDWYEEEDISDSNTECRQGIFILDASNLVMVNDAHDNSRYNCVKCGLKLGNFGHSSCGCGAIMKKGVWLNLTKVDRRTNLRRSLIVEPKSNLSPL